MVSSGLAPFAGRGLRGLRVGLVGGTILAM